MRFFTVLSLLLLPCVLVHSQHIVSPSIKSDSILLRTYAKLNSLRNIRYDNIREVNYPSDNYQNISTWAVYYDFQTTDTIAGFKYQVENSGSKQVFNGTEQFDLDKKSMTFQVNDSPDKESFSSLSFLYNSIITLKNSLLLLVADRAAVKALSDTIINNNLYSVVTIHINNRKIQNLGNGFDTITTKKSFIYKVIIEKGSYMPFEVLEVNDVNDDFIKTSFINMETDKNVPPEMSWYYSTYANDYKQAVDIAIPQLLPNGSLAPEWKLKAYNEDKMISLSDLKGKVILLDFWIKNCGPCIQSVPHLNELHNKFKGNDFQIVGINSYDSKEDVSWFCNKHKISYPVLLHGKAVAEEYGVSGFPTFFVIDKTGKIIYSSTGYEAAVQSEVEQVIKNAL